MHLRLTVAIDESTDFAGQVRSTNSQACLGGRGHCFERAWWWVRVRNSNFKHITSSSSHLSAHLTQSTEGSTRSRSTGTTGMHICIPRCM